MIIKNIEISNYRSLKNLTVPGLTSAVVLHGPNNSGKSNILLALQTIFAEKSAGASFTLSDNAVDAKLPLPTRATPFWNGVIADFADNFYMGSSNPIVFSVQVEVEPTQFKNIKDIGILAVPKAGHRHQFVIKGKIVRAGSDGEMHLSEVSINNKPLFNRKGENLEWLSSLPASIDSATKQSLGEAILNQFTGLVFVVPANRYLSTETEQQNREVLASSNFKNWLHWQSLSRAGFNVFKSVQKQLGGKPFNYGDISFVADGDQIDIMIDDGCGFRMPISQKGTGVQQILVLLGFIATRKAQVIAIEEPEVNLSFSNQDELVTTLLQLLLDKANPVSQILLASHSDHVGSRAELKRLHVENPTGTETKVRVFTVADKAALFPRSSGLHRTKKK